MPAPWPGPGPFAPKSRGAPLLSTYLTGGTGAPPQITSSRKIPPMACSSPTPIYKWASGTLPGIGARRRGMRPRGPSNCCPKAPPPIPLYVPAVRVKIDKNTGVNSGKVQFSFARVMGIADASPSAQAVAAVFPRKGKGIKSVPAQSCFPFATPLTWVTQHWNDDPPTSFRIGSTYHAEDGGEWTSFLIDANNVPTIRDLIDKRQSHSPDGGR